MSLEDIYLRVGRYSDPYVPHTAGGFICWIETGMRPRAYSLWRDVERHAEEWAHETTKAAMH